MIFFRNPRRQIFIGCFSPLCAFTAKTRTEPTEDFLNCLLFQVVVEQMPKLCTWILSASHSSCVFIVCLVLTERWQLFWPPKDVDKGTKSRCGMRFFLWTVGLLVQWPEPEVVLVVRFADLQANCSAAAAAPWCLGNVEIGVCVCEYKNNLQVFSLQFQCSHECHQ